MSNLIKKLGLGAIGLGALLNVESQAYVRIDLKAIYQEPIHNTPHFIEKDIHFENHYKDEERLNVYLKSKDGKEIFPLVYTRFGCDFIFKKPVELYDQTDLEIERKPIDIGGVDAAANIQMLLPTELNRNEVSAKLFSITGQEIRIDEFDYDQETGKLSIYSNMSSYPNGLYLALIRTANGEKYSTKFINNPQSSNSKKTTTLSNLESLTLKIHPETKTKKNFGLYDLVVEDPLNDLDTIFTDIPLVDGDTTNVRKLIRHHRKGELMYYVYDTHGNPITNKTIVLYNAYVKDTMNIKLGNKNYGHLFIDLNKMSESPHFALLPENKEDFFKENTRTPYSKMAFIFLSPHERNHAIFVIETEDNPYAPLDARVSKTERKLKSATYSSTFNNWPGSKNDLTKKEQDEIDKFFQVSFKENIVFKFFSDVGFLNK